MLKKGGCLKKKVTNPLTIRYRLELDISELLDGEPENYFQNLTGILKCIVELGRVKIHNTTAFLSYFLANLRLVIWRLTCIPYPNLIIITNPSVSLALTYLHWVSLLTRVMIGSTTNLTPRMNFHLTFPRKRGPQSVSHASFLIIMQMNTFPIDCAL